MASKELAQNGVRREAVPGPSCGARRTLCASKELALDSGPRSTIPARTREKRTPERYSQGLLRPLPSQLRIGFALAMGIVPKTLIPDPPSTPRWLTYMSISFKTDVAEPSRRGCIVIAVLVVLYLAFIIFAGRSIAQFAASHGIVLFAGELSPVRSSDASLRLPQSRCQRRFPF